jgi:DNA repair exonuclease SbcCD ATPase subunit
VSSERERFQSDLTVARAARVRLEGRVAALEASAADAARLIETERAERSRQSQVAGEAQETIQRREKEAAEALRASQQREQEASEALQATQQREKEASEAAQKAQQREKEAAERLATLQAELPLLREQAESLGAEKRILLEDQSRLESRIRELTSRLEASEADKPPTVDPAMAEELERLKERGEAHEAEVSELRESLARAKEQEESLRASLTARGEKLDEAQQRLVMYDQELAALRRAAKATVTAAAQTAVMVRRSVVM